jgi:soluble lytic murein transglycosylase-like protein
LRFYTVSLLRLFVTAGKARCRVASCITAMGLATMPALAEDPAFPILSEPLAPGRYYSAVLWEEVDETPGNSPESAEPPVGPPLWDGNPASLPAPVATGAAPATNDKKDKTGKADKAAKQAAPAPKVAVKVNPKEPVIKAAEPKKEIYKNQHELVGTELPTAEKIAFELGYKPGELKRYADDFASSLATGPRSAAFRRLCARDEESCRLLADFHAQAADAKRERRRVRRRVKHFRITEENVSQAQRFDFGVLANNLKVENSARLASLAERSLKEGECPRNLSAALAIKAEEYFPDPKTRSLARELFDHARQCIVFDDEVYERLYLRSALYAIYDGDKSRAKFLLQEAKKSTNSTERYRVLYWLGRLAFDENGKESEEWTELMNKYPLSYYAIEAATSLKKDPMDMITQRKVGGLKREAPNDPELTRMIRWLEALYVYKESSAVAKWASWIVRANEGELDVDILLYLSSLKIATGLYRSNISMLFSYFRKNPAALNTEGLKLLYPRPYYSLIQQASKGKIDSFLVLGLVRQESGFDARAISRAKAKGLMQIIPTTARRLASQGHKKLLDEKENTKMGVKYLLQLADDFNGSAELVLAGYNAGPHRVTEWLRRNPDRGNNVLLWNDLIPFMETRDYVVSIVRNNYLYLRLYGSPEGEGDKLFSSAMVKDLMARKPSSND